MVSEEHPLRAEDYIIAVSPPLKLVRELEGLLLESVFRLSV
jgi:hypothetical protein